MKTFSRDGDLISSDSDVFGSLTSIEIFVLDWRGVGTGRLSMEASLLMFGSVANNGSGCGLVSNFLAD